MRATLNAGRAAAGATVAAVQNYAETTIDILRYVILRCYIAGLVLSLPFGWFGDAMARNHYADWMGWRHFGYVPGCLSFLFVSFFYWIFEARLVAGELPLEALPKWVQNRVAQWTTQTGSTYRFFFGTSMVGLWFPILLWVPAEFPVWRHPFHYLGALCVTMAVTQFVATSEAKVRYWRQKYGYVVAAIGVRHVLGFMGFEIEDLWAKASGQNFSALGTTELVFIAAAIAIVAVMFDNGKQTSH